MMHVARTPTHNLKILLTTEEDCLCLRAMLNGHVGDNNPLAAKIRELFTTEDSYIRVTASELREMQEAGLIK